MSVPVKPTIEDHHSEHHVRLHERVFEGRGLLIAGPNIYISVTPDGEYIISARAGGLTGNGGYQGEYDQTRVYTAGQTFKISTATTIGGIAVKAGFYGVPPAGEDVLGQVWAGYVPANPTGNAVPQHPLPSLGAAPNDKFYADLIGEYCA